MKHFVFWTVFVVLFSEFDSIFDGLFNGCSFIDNNPASIHLYCNGSTETPRDDCTSLIESKNLPSNVTELKISACDVEMTWSLKNFALRIPIGLRKLDVSYNKHNPFVEYLLEESSSEQLKYLNASHCELDALSPSKMPNLVEIDLSFNKIEYIYPTYFYKTKSLNLDLSRNALTSIGKHAFDGCVNLKTFRIEYLDACAIFRLMFERMIQVDYKYISKLDTSCMNSLEIESDNDELVIRNTNNGYVRRFPKYQLQNLTSATFGPNQLKHTTKILEMLGTSIKDLDISGNFIGELTQNTFDRFDELTRLILDRTNLTLSNFNPFENLSKLTQLSMANNNLQYLKTTILNKTLNNLTIFGVGYNGLENIDEVIDCLSSRITYLAISGNPLREIKPDTFARFRNLEYLLMNHNNLQSIDFNVLKHCRNVFISVNNLTNANFTLPANERSSVNGLYIDGNNLTELPGLNNASYPLLKILRIEGNPMSCEYVMKLESQWKDLEVESDACKKKGLNDQGGGDDDEEEDIEPMIGTASENILTSGNSAMTEMTTEEKLLLFIMNEELNRSPIDLTYVVPIGIVVIVVIVAIGIGVVWFIWRRRQAVVDKNQVSDPIYEEIGPPTNVTQYNHLNFRDPPPNNRILDHYKNNRANQTERNNENDLDIGENIEMKEQNINPPYNRLNWDALPNNKILEHYDNATANQSGQNKANEAEALEVDQPNDDEPYDHLQLAVPPPNNKILDHYKNAPPQNQVNDSSDSSDSE